MSLTLFPTNKRQSWARARDRELARRAKAGRGDLELERRPRAAVPARWQQPDIRLGIATGISITISTDAATSLPVYQASPSRSCSSCFPSLAY